jgi:hypothetical protein
MARWWRRRRRYLSILELDTHIRRLVLKVSDFIADIACKIAP